MNPTTPSPICGMSRTNERCVEAGVSPRLLRNRNAITGEADADDELADELGPGPQPEAALRGAA